MPACGRQCGSTSVPVRPIFTSKHSRPSRGAKPREADDTRPPRGLPHQAGSRGVERSRQGKPGEVPVTQAMTGGRQAGASARSVLVSSLVLKRQAQRGVPRHEAKVSISVQRDQDQQDGRTEVTVEPKMASPPEPLAGEDHL